MKTMKAIVYYGIKDIRIEQIPVPPCGDKEIRIKVDACAVCGTDLKTYYYGNPRIKAPNVMGHEFTGVVESIGNEVKGFAPNERIVMATSVACHHCSYCTMGYYNLCEDLRPMGFFYAGGMAEYVTIPERALVNGHVVKVPITMKAEHAALAEPLSCAVNAAENANVKRGDSVVISGAGPLGIMNLCVVRTLGASKIILAEISAARLEQAKQFDCDILINPAEEDLTAKVKQATNGLGADVAIVAAPAAAPQEVALDLVRKRGSVCLFASLPAEKSVLNLDSRKIHYGEIRVVGTSDSTPAHVKKAIDLLSGDDFPAEKIASHLLALDDIFKAFELMKSGDSLRVILKP